MPHKHDHRRAALYASAILSECKDLDYMQRGSIVSRVHSHGPHSVTDLGFELGTLVAGTDVGRGTNGCGESDRLSETVEQWMRNGVYLIESDGDSWAGDRLDELAPVFFARGDKSLLRRPIAAILNSRKPRRISPHDRWVRSTLGAVQIAVQQDYVIATSYGAGPYDLVGAAALRRASPVIVVCPDVLPFMACEDKGCKFAGTHGKLFESDQNLILSPFSPGISPRPAARMRRRDELVAALAQFLLIAEIRDRGIMTDVLSSTIENKDRVSVFVPNVVDEATAGNALVREMGGDGKIEILSEGLIEDLWPTPRCERQETSSRGEPAELVLNPLEKDAYLIHYTRSCPGPWPGQTVCDYYHSLIDNRSGAAHSAFDTLKRILSEKLLRAGSTFVRGTTRVVSFTEQMPHEIGELVRWRRGLIRWTFEPYGIAIDRRFLVNLGAEPVVYGDEESFRELLPRRGYLFQLRVSGSHDWSVEREWRIACDVRLDEIPEKHVIVVVPSLEEAQSISSEFGCKVTLAGTSVEKNF